MSRQYALILAAVLCVGAAAPAHAGGRPIPMIEIIDAPVVWPPGATADVAVVQRAVQHALIAKGWVGQLVQPGLYHAVLKRDDWTAEIDIPFTATSYSIKYAASERLDYNEQKHVIHRNFNKWLGTLRQLIDAETSQAP